MIKWFKRELSFYFHNDEWEQISYVYLGYCLFPEQPAPRKYKVTYKNKISGDIRWEYRVG